MSKTNMRVSYDEYMNSPEWWDTREKVITRCGGICEVCKTRKVIHVHHITYERLGSELLDDLLGLCMVCHQAAHPDKKLKRCWLLISKLCERLNVTVHSLKRVLVQEGLIEKQITSWGLEEQPNGKLKTVCNTAWRPTTKAFQRKMCKKRRKSYVWDFDLVTHVLESRNTTISERCNKNELNS